VVIHPYYLLFFGVCQEAGKKIGGMAARGRLPKKSRGTGGGEALFGTFAQKRTPRFINIVIDRGEMF